MPSARMDGADTASASFFNSILKRRIITSTSQATIRFVRRVSTASFISNNPVHGCGHGPGDLDLILQILLKLVQGAAEPGGIEIRNGLRKFKKAIHIQIQRTARFKISLRLQQAVKCEHESF